ncbi:uncharacterized protein [Gorilla gorilla gorilla]|uniref:uncharacterized protein n=1 Tax=Gorilla gorilla gorilla TaxID=9595 RepID=UPI00300A2EE0
MLSPNRRNLKVWVQSLRSYTGSTQGHNSWTGSNGACSSWTGSTRGHSSWTGSSRACSSWTGSRMIHSLRSSSRAYSSWTGSSHKNHSPPWSPHRSHSPPWSPHRSHSPPWSPHRSHSWSRNRLAHSSTRACSSRQAHSSWSHIPHSRSHSPHSRSHSPHSRSHIPHSRSHSPHSRCHSPHSRSHSLQSSHSSPWFWWIEGGAGRGAGEREVQVWSSLSLGPLYPCPGSGVKLGTWSLPGSSLCHSPRKILFAFLKLETTTFCLLCFAVLLLALRLYSDWRVPHPCIMELTGARGRPLDLPHIPFPSGCPHTTPGHQGNASEQPPRDPESLARRGVQDLVAFTALRAGGWDQLLPPGGLPSWAAARSCLQGLTPEAASNPRSRMCRVMGLGGARHTRSERQSWRGYSSDTVERDLCRMSEKEGARGRGEACVPVLGLP